MNRQAKSLQGKAKKHEVTSIGKGHYWVDSASSGKRYLVVEDRDWGFTCTCDWSQYHDTRVEPCSHVLAVRDALENGYGRSLSFWSDEDAAKRQHQPIEYVGRGLLATSRIKSQNRGW